MYKEFQIVMLIGLTIGLIVIGTITCIELKKNMKFCPDCGHRYFQTNVSYCKYDGTELKNRGN